MGIFIDFKSRSLPLMKIFYDLFRIFFIGICAVAMVLQTKAVFGLPLEPGILEGFIFGGTIFGYHFTHPERHFRVIAFGAGAAGALCFVAWARSFHLVLIAAFPVLFWLAYYGFRRPGNRVGLRTWAQAKPLTVATAWAWVTVLLPLPTDMWVLAIPVFLTRAAFVYALALAYDFSDMDYDRLKGLSTLAQSMEASSNFSLINWALVLSGVFVALGYFTGVYTSSHVMLICLSLGFSAWFIHFILKKSAWHAFHKTLIDALLPFQSLLILLLR